MVGEVNDLGRGSDGVIRHAHIHTLRYKTHPVLKRRGWAAVKDALQAEVEGQKGEEDGEHEGHGERDLLGGEGEGPADLYWGCV